MERAVRWLAVIAAFGMGVVLLQGTLVTNSGSQYGCGNTWPLCHGKIIPEFSGIGGAATLIEYLHRIVVPVESTLILALIAGLLWYHRGRREAQVLAPAMFLFLMLQAVLGGLAVMFPTSAGVLALHFGVSLIAFASVLLTASFLLELGGPDAIRDQPVPPTMLRLIWGSIVYTYVVVYLGAYVRHVGASLSCLDWPLCNGALVPRFVSGVGAQYAHRLAALGSVLLVGWLVQQAHQARRSRPDLFRGATVAMVLIVLQALSGGIVVYTRLAVLSTLLHSALISLLFGTLAYLCLHTLRRPAAARAAQRVAAHRPSGAVTGPVRAS